MVVDTSAVIAIMLRESRHGDFLDKILDSGNSQMSAVSYMEAAMVLIVRVGDGAEEAIDRMLDEAAVVIVPVSVEQAKLARTAFRQYGKGRHPAGLNFGDCFSYALARSTGESLRFKGMDFARTGIESA